MFKTLTLAAAASIAFASGAYANNAFPFNEANIDSATVDLGQISTDGAGVVSLYDFHAGVQGALLGTTDVSTGANYDVRVTLDRKPVNDVVAVLTVNGQIVDTQELDTVR